MSTILIILWCLFLSWVWAVLGHGLYLGYRFLWRAFFDLLGVRKAAPAGPVMEPEGGGGPASLGPWFRAHGVRILGLAGAALAAWAFFWLLEDLAVEDLYKKWIQMGALLLLTTSILGWGYILRRRGPDLLGTGLMLLGFFMLPADAQFYETYIIGHTTHSSYKLLLFMSFLGHVVHIRTGSRAFAWLSPPFLAGGILMVGDKLGWDGAVVSYVACLLAPLMLAGAEWLNGSDVERPMLRPWRLTAVLTALAALGAGLSSTPDLFPTLHLMIALLGGGTVATVGFLELDLRATLLLVPYFVPLTVHRFSEYGVGFGFTGPILAIAGLGLLAVERGQRRGRERRRGLMPWCSVPACVLLLFAFVADSTTGLSLLERIGTLGAQWTLRMEEPWSVVNGWVEAQRSVFYLARRDGILLATALSGLACSLGLAYIGSQARVRLLDLMAGVPLAIALICGLNALAPFELHGPWHFAPVGIAAGAFLTASIVWRRRMWGAGVAPDGFAFVTSLMGAFRLGGHLLVPPAWLLTGYAVFGEGGTPGWFVAILAGVIGAQCLVQHRIGPPSAALRNLGAGLVCLAWPLSLTTISRWNEAMFMTFVTLSILGLVVQVAVLWRALIRDHGVPALLAALSLFATLGVLADRVRIGGMFSKLVILALGLGLLWLGTRGRRGASGAPGAMIVLVLLLSASTSSAGTRTVITRDSLTLLGTAHPEDPLIQVRLRAAGLPTPAHRTATDQWKALETHLAGASGIDSAAAALQIAASPLRLAVPDDHRGTAFLGDLAPPRHEALDYRAFARRLGRDLPAPGADPLDRVPADRIYLRFQDAASLRRVLDTYGSAGRSLLRVTAPGLSLPGPEEPFRRRLGASLVELVAGGESGVVSLGDPYLAVAGDAALLLRMPDAPAAASRSAAWAGRFGATRTAAVDRLAVLVTEETLLRAMTRSLGAPGPLADSLARAEDFRYTRLLGIPAGDGFLFIGEAFIQKLSRAWFWIPANRRTDCLADLADLEAAVAFGRITGRPLPGDPVAARDEAVHRTWMRPGGACREGGEPVREGSGLACSRHGSRAEPRPLETPIQAPVRVEEGWAYHEYVRRYEGLYRRFIDPIALGIEVTPPEVRVETVILPVARLPYYQTLLPWTRTDRHDGPIPHPPGADRALAAVAFRGQLDSGGWVLSPYQSDPARRVISRLVQGGALGSTVGLVLLPGDLSAFLEPPALWRDERPLPILGFHDVGHPERALDFARSMFDSAGSTTGEGRRSFRTRLLGRKWLHGALSGKAFVLGTDAGQVRDALAGPRTVGSLPDALAWIRVRPRELWRARPPVDPRTFDVLSEGCAEILASRQNLLELGTGGAAPGADLPVGDPFPDPAARCPAGGEHTVAGATISCTLHGTHDAPRPASPGAGSPLDQALAALEILDVELAATPGGIRTRVVIRGHD